MALAGCHSAMENKEAVQRGIWDRLKATGFTPETMDVDVTNVEFHGNKADAQVEIRPKGATHDAGMKMSYGLEARDGRWVVVSHADSTGAHGGAVPGSPNPHAGAMPPPDSGAGAKMPSPQDLPPAGGKQ